MSRALLIIDPQEGWAHQASTPVFDDILEFATQFAGDVLIQQFFNEKNTQFHSQLAWYRFTTEDDTRLIEPFRRLDAKTFKHTTYGCLTSEVNDYLQAKQITTVYMCGVFTDVCIAMTAMQLFDEGYRTVVLRDLVATLHGPRVHQAEIMSLEHILGKAQVIDAADIDN